MDMLSEGIRTLLKTAAGVLPATGFGVVRKDGPEHVVVTYADAFGATAYRASARDIPEPFWPGAAGPRRVTAADLEANPLGLVESRLLHTTLSADIKRQHGVQQVLTRPVAGSDESATMVVGLVDPNPRSAAEMAELEAFSTFWARKSRWHAKSIACEGSTRSRRFFPPCSARSTSERSSIACLRPAETFCVTTSRRWVCSATISS
jgi:hypothetical protein